MNIQRRLEEYLVLRKDRMAEVIQLCEMLDGLMTDFRSLQLHVLAVTLSIAEQPQLMKTFAHTVENMQNVGTTTAFRHAMATEVVILK